MANLERLHGIVEPLLADLDATLYDLEFSGGLLRITLDRAGGIDLDSLSEANRRISRALDIEDPIPGRYTLEVTSPGLERALRTNAHYQRAIGERIRVKLRPGVDGDRRIDGVLTEVDEDRITVLTDSGALVAALADIERARTVFLWGPSPKPGTPKQGSAKTGSPDPGNAKSRPAAGTGRLPSNPPSEVS